MSLTKKQIEEYREKLRDSDYMEMAISDIADKFSAFSLAIKKPGIS
jgi:hypothetical protein